MRTALLPLLLLTTLAAAEPVTLVRDGQPLATIVTAGVDGGVEQTWAADIQRYVKALSGVELPIAADGKRVDGLGIYLGECEGQLESDLPPADASPESFAIRVRDGGIRLVGRHWPARAFAVATFIEEGLGVRWFVPGPLGEVIPQGRPGELSVDVPVGVRIPDWSPRIWSGNGYGPDWTAWNWHNKLSIGGPLPLREFQNKLHGVFPPSRYAEEHPEYYPLINGERWIPPEDNYRYWRPCESNPEVIRLTVEAARQWFDANPDSDSFSLGMDDIVHLCGCDDCRALDPDPQAYAERRFSDRHYKFVNAVAREVAKTHPDRRIGTLIYSIARELPETVERLEPNVFGTLTQTAAEWHREGRRAADEALSRAWGERADTLLRYDYFGLGFVTPRYYPHWMAEALKFDHANNFKGIYIEVYTNWANTGPMVWAASKLFWNTDRDIDALLNEYMNGMFGAAAPQMAAYFDHLERSWTTAPRTESSWGHGNWRAQAEAMTPEQVREAERLLARAMVAADSDIVRQRIDMVGAGLEFGRYLIEEGALSRELKQAEVTDAASAQQAFEQATALADLIEERKTAWERLLARDDLVGENLRALRDEYRANRGFDGNLGTIEDGLPQATVKLLSWAATQPEGLPMLDRWLSQRPDGALAELVRDWQWVQATQPANLLANGDFEAVGANTAEAALDWETSGAPPKWSRWSRTPHARFAPATDPERGRVASLAGAENGCYIQSVEVQPGARYLCVVDVKLTSPAPALGTLTARWQTATGGWLDTQAHDVSAQLTPVTDRWQRLMIPVTAPDGAGRLALLIGASRQADEGAALFDSAAVYRIDHE